MPGESIAQDGTTAPLQLVATAVGAPAFVTPYLDRFYEPAETALSIMSEVVAARFGGSGSPMRDRVSPPGSSGPPRGG